jgi:predicted O-methyltransferase YrrM
MIHPVVDEVLRTGMSPLRDGRVVRANSYIPRESCELLYDVVRRAQATQAVEIGMAFGVSTVCLADALRQSAGAAAKLIAFDPTQTMTDSWNGAGVWQVERAGLSAVVELREQESQTGLPLLLENGYRCQVAFIDGWHTFDHTLIDFFYIDRMLDIGGFVVFDDVGYAAINTVVRFVLANRDYELVEALQIDMHVPASLRLKRLLKRPLRRLARTDHDPVRHEALFRRFAEAHTVALRKKGDDHRRFDHFAPF